MAVRRRRLFAARSRMLFFLFGESFDSRQWTSLHREIVDRTWGRGRREHLIQRQRLPRGRLNIFISAQRIPPRKLADPSHLEI